MSGHRRPLLAAALIAAALGLAYVIIAPASGDLAAHLYRSDLFGRAGLAVWDNGWYGGHPTLAYSVLFPPLGWLLGVRVAGAVAATIAAAAFADLASAHGGGRGGAGGGARVASIWFAVGVSEWLLAGRLPFLLGTALALLALVAYTRGRPALAVAGALAAALASPLAGAFLALAGVALALAPPRRVGAAAPRSFAPPTRRAAGALVAGALAPVVALSVAFGEGGSEPFAGSSFWPGFALTLVVLVALLGSPGRPSRVFAAPPAPRTAPSGAARTAPPALLAGIALYALASLAAFLVATPVGGNAIRLGTLFAGPVVALSLWDRRRVALALLALPLAYWQLQAPARDAAVAAGDRSTSAAYFRPLLDWLATQPGPFRIEVPFTRLHQEATYVAERFPIARGWERQLDIELNPIFYRRSLSAAEYDRWLHANSIRYVALPDVAFDYSGRAEAALVARGEPHLQPVWRNAHWRVFAVAAPRPPADPPATLTAIGAQGFTLRFAGAGTSAVRIRFSRYWALMRGHGCVERAPGGFTRVSSTAAGTVVVGIRFSLARVFEQGRRCS